MTKMTLNEIYEKLKAEQGPKKEWWSFVAEDPKDRQLEVMIGSILLPQTKWQAVEKAITAIYKDGKSLDAMLALGEEELKARIHEAGVGYYNQKAKYLHQALKRIKEEHDGSVENIFRLSDDVVRDKLTKLKGVGKGATADYIMLFGGSKKVLPATPQAKRILARLGHLKEDVEYPEAKVYMERNFSGGLDQYKDFTAQLVDFANSKCSEDEPACERGYKCPLEGGCAYRGANVENGKGNGGSENNTEKKTQRYDIIIIRRESDSIMPVGDILRTAAKEYEKKETE